MHPTLAIMYLGATQADRERERAQRPNSARIRTRRVRADRN
jgi:hypothetical protein